MKRIKESEDNSIGATLYQGKPLSQWEREFDGEFSAKQLFQLLKSGVDLGRIKLGLVDEADAADIDDPAFKGEEFFFNEKEKEEQMNEVSDEEAALDESAQQPEDVVTVGDFVELLESRTKLDDKIMFRTNKSPCVLFDVQSKGGTALVDLVKGKYNDNVLEDEEMNEGRGWYGGGYGGTGRSYSSLGSKAPRGAEIGWYQVDQLDPKAKGKISSQWRCGPSNFPFNDALYQDRKYKRGAMVLRNKYVNAGAMSGVVEIGVPSYFDAINNNDERALEMLRLLGIPLDLTFGMDPKDDYTMTYTTVG